MPTTPRARSRDGAPAEGTPMLELRQAFEWLSAGRLLAADPGDGGLVLTGVSTDTRSVRPGELFVALRGERFDAHDFVGQALAAGAGALLVDRWTEGCRPPALWVADTRRGLGEIAAGWRRRFALPVIAVTGSNGKTTVKEMIASVLAEHVGEDARLATPGTLNNEIGVPLSVLRLEARHRAAVFELGMNHPGEIAWLASIAQAGVALVNNAQREHQEFMHTVEATARENGAAIEALPADGVAVFPGDDPHAPLWRAFAGSRRVVEFGLDARCAVRAPADARPDGFEMTVDGDTVVVRLAIDGAHSVRNALATAACCRAIGVPLPALVRGLEAFRPVAGRLRRRRAATGAVLVDDSYNANPDSVRAAIDVLAAHAGPRVLVLGDMAEVGEQGPQFHEEVGAYARSRGVGRLLAFGPRSLDTVRAFGDGAEHFDSIDALSARAASIAPPDAMLLVKGSRSTRMERVVQALAADDADGGRR
jgi:UDP-N-acetylmuramoyl-tripeptide--D-alanyl-D-alanine ligase